MQQSAEDIEKENAGDEGRRADAEDTEHDDRPVEPRAAAEGGDRPEQDAEAENENGAHQAQEDGDAEPIRDGARHRPVALDGDAEVALDHLRQPLAVLYEERIVQVVALADGGERCRV